MARLRREIILVRTTAVQSFSEDIKTFHRETKTFWNYAMNHLERSESLHANKIQKLGTDMIIKCIRFLEFTKIRICRPGGPNINQQCVY